MCISGVTCWKWPEKTDTLWYEEDDVKEVMPAPEPANTRGVSMYRKLKSGGKNKIEHVSRDVFQHNVSYSLQSEVPYFIMLTPARIITQFNC